MSTKKVLNVGGNSKEIPLPPEYQDFEHHYWHDVPKVLAGFLHVLKASGFAHIQVPDIRQVMQATLDRNLEMDDILYESVLGPIMVLDVLYGLSSEIETSGQDFFAHKTGFTEKTLLKVLNQAGFLKTYSTVASGNLQITALAFKGEPDNYAKTLFSLPNN